MEKVRYEEMLPHEIVERRKKFPAAFIGLGGLEWHSEHLGVGNDALKAEALCKIAAARSGGFAFPTLWYGEPREVGLMEPNYDPDGGIKRLMAFNPDKFTDSYFGKTPAEEVAFYQELLYHVFIQMNTLEMKAVCLLCGHYPIFEWSKPVVARFNANFKDTQVATGCEHHYPPKSEDVGGDHAAKWETSFLWYLRPDCVDMSVYLGRDSYQLVGIMGTDPRQSASIEIGRKATDLVVDAMVQKARDLVALASQP